MRRILSIFCGLFILAECAAATRQCNLCKENVLDSDKFCPYCGQVLIVQPEPLSPQTSQSVPAPSYSPIQQIQPSDYSYDEHHHHEPEAVEFSLVDRFGGMGRGLVTITLSPFNVVRGVGTGLHWIFADRDTATVNESGINGADLGPLGGVIAIGGISIFAAGGAVCGMVTTCADAVNGVLDTVSIGYYGDWLYDSKWKGTPTPWIWERKWWSNEFPWIDRE